MGTPAMARACLVGLAEAGHDIAGVVTRPDKPAGRGRKLTPPPVKEEALTRGLEVIQPDSVRTPEFLAWLKAKQPDFLIVIAYGRLMPDEVLAVPTKAPINVHYSLLPAWRGPAPVNWAIASGDAQTGVTTMLIDRGMDTGDILLQKTTPIGPMETAGELSQRLSALGVDLLLETVSRFDELTPQTQEHDQATYARPIKPEDGRLDLTRPAHLVAAWGRGMSPWPGALVEYGGQRLKLFDLSHDDTPTDQPPGAVLAVDKSGLAIACGQGRLIVGRVQHPGRKVIPAQAAAGGSGPKPGDRLT